MERGWWAASHKLAEAAAGASVDVSASVHSAAGRIRGRLAALTEAVAKATAAAATGGAAPLTGIPPAFEWAQSPDSLFLNVKFSHKIDTPATLGCEVTTANFTGGDSIVFAAACTKSAKRFLLDLPLLGEVAPEQCSWNLLSVGRAQVSGGSYLGPDLLPVGRAQVSENLTAIGAGGVWLPGVV